MILLSIVHHITARMSSPAGAAHPFVRRHSASTSIKDSMSRGLKSVFNFFVAPLKCAFFNAVIPYFFSLFTTAHPRRSSASGGTITIRTAVFPEN